MSPAAVLVDDGPGGRQDLLGRGAHPLGVRDARPGVPRELPLDVDHEERAARHGVRW